MITEYDDEPIRGLPGELPQGETLLWQGSPEQAGRMVWTKPDERLVQFENASPTWPLQVKQQMGMTGPQDQATLPVSRCEPRSLIHPSSLLLLRRR